MEPALAILHGIKVRDLARAFHPCLTGAEAIKLAAQTFQKNDQILGAIKTAGYEARIHK